MSEKKIAIVGGGVAGLTAGIYGRLAGYDVDIFEKNPSLGGQCTGWDRHGFHIDNCIHWLTGTKAGTDLHEIWKETGALSPDQTFVATDRFYTSESGGTRVTLWKDLEKTQQELCALSPEDSEEIRKFIEHVRYATTCEMPAKKPMDVWNPMDYLRMGATMRDMPKVMKEYGSIDLHELAERFHHPALQALFSDYMPKDYVASSFLVSYATLVSGNGEIPTGGSRALTARMANRFAELGGRVHCCSSVSEILVDHAHAIGIRTADGNRIFADYVISAVDTMELFDRLLGRQYMGKKWESAYADSGTYPLFSAVQAAFAVDRADWNESGTLFFDCDPFETGGRQVTRLSVKGYEYEPEFAPPGKVVVQINVPQYDAEYLHWQKLSPGEYAVQKAEAASALQKRMEDRFGLAGKITPLDCWTPRTYEKWCNAYHGAYMAFITRKGVPSFSVKGIVKGVKNLYIASQWIMAPGGLPVAAAAGRFAIWRIARCDRKHVPELL